jgi:hypothetical protein
VANKVFLNQEHDKKQGAGKRMKAKVSLFPKHWGSQTQSRSQLHHGRGDPVGGPISDETNVPIARRLATGRMNAHTTR